MLLKFLGRSPFVTKVAGLVPIVTDRTVVPFATSEIVDVANVTENVGAATTRLPLPIKLVG